MSVIRPEQGRDEMTMKEEVLRQSETSGKDNISGQVMGDRLHVPSFDAIDAGWIENELKSAGLNIKVIYKDETGSTNEDARAAIGSCDSNSVLVIADRQNAGRGRRGRDFYSPEGTGLYMSLALPDAQKLLETVKLTAIAAVAVAEAIDIQVYNGRNTALIKWVNDIYIDDKKVCGILCEAFLPTEDGDKGCVVAGIGINVYEPVGDFPEDIRNKAGYLIERSHPLYMSGAEGSKKERAALSQVGLRSRLAADIVKRLYSYVNCDPEWNKDSQSVPNWQQNHNRKQYQKQKQKQKQNQNQTPKRNTARNEAVLAAYRSRSNLTGCLVRINSFAADMGEDNIATVRGIDDEYRLLVEYGDGHTEALSSGEVSVIKVMNSSERTAK